MTIAEKIKENLPYGQAVLAKLFQLNSTDLKAKVKELCGSDVANFDHLFRDGDVEKTYKNDEPWGITISYFDQISIDALGITLMVELSTKGRFLVLFDKNFKYE